MALDHAGPGEAWSVEPLGKRLKDARSAALFKSEQLEVIRLVLLAGKSLPSHTVPGEVTLQCLEGSLSVQAQGQTLVLRSGQITYLRGREVHAVEALEDSSALLTIVLPPGRPGS